MGRSKVFFLWGQHGGRCQGKGGQSPPLPSPHLFCLPSPIPFPPLPFPLHSLPLSFLPPLPLGRSRPLNPARGLGSSVSSPSVVGAPAKIEFV